jgi:hypothetical protein
VPSIYYYFWGSTLLLQFPIETFAEYNKSHVLDGARVLEDNNITGYLPLDLGTGQNYQTSPQTVL